MSEISSNKNAALHYIFIVVLFSFISTEIIVSPFCVLECSELIEVVDLEEEVDKTEKEHKISEFLAASELSILSITHDFMEYNRQKSNHLLEIHTPPPELAFS